MGIQGLIPFLEKTSRPINISEFSGCTVAIDAYCWLHKGAFSCAEKLARGEKCDAYVYYCMKYINMLLSHNIKPIMVFDGQHLPAKADTEKKRRENRELNRRRAAELLRQDKPNEARTYIRRCVDITHGMALELMHACRAINVDCITAPHEADAELAYLNLTGIAHVVITEDSDLILFGCKKVVFKMDHNGGGLLVEQEKLHLSIKSRPENYSFEKFRRMCILSGCDYLPSLPGIGLSKACRFMTRTMDPDIDRALTRMSSYLNMPQLVVTKEYRKNFVHAEAMFKHQPVFDPIQRKVLPLTPIEDDTPQLRLPEPLPSEQAYQLALGNLDPFSLKVVADWNPDELKAEKKKWSSSRRASHPSIWSKNFKIIEPKLRPVKAKLPCSTAGKQIVQDPKIEFEPSIFMDDKDIENGLFDHDESIGTSTPPFKKVCLSGGRESENRNEMEVDKEEKDRLSPILSEKSIVTSKLLNKFKSIRNTVVDEKTKVQSRYFSKSPCNPKTNNSISETTENLSSDRQCYSDEKERLKDISNFIDEKSNNETKRNSSPKKAKGVISETSITPHSPRTKSFEEQFPPISSSGLKASCFSKQGSVRKSLLSELSFEEDRDNDSGVSCPSSYELDCVEECSQTSIKNNANNSSSSAFNWKQKFHEKFGFKNTSSEKILQSSKAVDNGFQSPSTFVSNETEHMKHQSFLDKSVDCKNSEIPVSKIKRSNPFKVDNKSNAPDPTPKFNLLRDQIDDHHMNQDIKDQICDLGSPPAKSQQINRDVSETPRQKSEKSSSGNNKTSGSSSLKGKCRSVGLGRKSSTPKSSGNSSTQRSLLSMFALQPKPKMECK